MSTSSDTGLSAEQVEAVENMALTYGGEATATPETPAGENQTTNETTATGAEDADGDGQQQSNGDSKTEAEVGTLEEIMQELRLHGERLANIEEALIWRNSED